MRRPTVLLADDHRIVAEGLKRLLGDEFDLVAMVENGREMVAAARQLRPEVVVADIAMPHLNGLDALVQLQKLNPSPRVVFLTMHRDVAYARRAFEGGAAGFVLKHAASDELIMAIRAALDGRTFITPALAGEVLESLQRHPHAGGDPLSRLSPRQREILQLLAEGRSAKEIGATLGISSRTVEFHKYQMMESLRVDSNAELIRLAVKHGLVTI
ncbi:MAG: response regulator transcription factor [Verrucomicrobiota bacterium]